MKTLRSYFGAYLALLTLLWLLVDTPFPNLLATFHCVQSLCNTVASWA